MNEKSRSLYRKIGADGVTIGSDAVTPPPLRVLGWPSWRRPVYNSKILLWPIKGWRRQHAPWRRHLTDLANLSHFVEFFTFMLRKRPKCFLFFISSPKHLKWQKERFRAIFDQINTISGLMTPEKRYTFRLIKYPYTWDLLVLKQMRFSSLQNYMLGVI